MLLCTQLLLHTPLLYYFQKYIDLIIHQPKNYYYYFHNLEKIYKIDYDFLLYN